MGDDKAVRVIIGDDELASAQEAARQTGLDVRVEPAPQFIEPISAILLGGGAVLVAKFVIDLMDRRKGGVMVDVRPHASYLVRREKALPYGWALIIAVDGSVRIETHDAPKDALERLLSDLVSGVLKTADKIGESAANALGTGRVTVFPNVA